MQRLAGITMVDVSIIIVNYKTADLVLNCVRSINEKSSGFTYEIIIVDNASEDDSVEKLTGIESEKVKIVLSQENLGFGRGNNLGAEHSNGEYLFLLNPDTYLLNNAIKELLDYIKSHPEVGVAGGNLYFPNETPAPSFCLEFDSIENEKRNASWGSILSKKINDKRGKHKEKPFFNTFNYSKETIPVAYVFGADMMIRRSVFENVGGFDPAFFMYAEEEELTWRIKNNGYLSVCVPQARIVHLEGAATNATGAFNPKQFGMRMRGKLLYFEKCFGAQASERFYNARQLQFKRLLIIEKIRGKNIEKSNTKKKASILEEVYNNYKNR